MKRNLHSSNIESEDDLTPPPESGPSSAARTASSSKKAEDNQMDVDEPANTSAPGDGSPVLGVSWPSDKPLNPLTYLLQSRRAKRKVLYVQSDSDAASSEEEVVRPKSTGSKGESCSVPSA